MHRSWLSRCGIALFAVAVAGGCADDSYRVDQARSALVLSAPNDFGVAESISTLGPIDFSGPFFRTDLGTNGRSCASCHDPASGWTISADVVKALFDDTDGTDPLFASTHDMGTRPDADTSTFDAKKEAFRPVWKFAQARFSTTIAPTAEFEVVAVEDPYGWSTIAAFSRFRRPNPLVNEGLQATTTWTGGPHDVATLLVTIFNNGTRFHGQTTTDVPMDIRIAARDFMMSIYHAQAEDDVAGRLDADGARGGPVHLSEQEFFIGINDPNGPGFNPRIFDIYDAWLGADDYPSPSARDRRRAAIARGQEVFNTKTFGASGITCGRCHNAPNVGSTSTPRWFNIGTADADKRFTQVPLVTLRNKATGELMQTTDPGRALVTGKWSDVGRFKAQNIRGLAGRAPYFHDGSAKTIMEVIKHYEDRFSIDFVGTERKDLEAFLSAL